MFLLPDSQLPQTAEALADAIEEGLRAFVSRPEKMVSVCGGNLRALDVIAIDLSGATIDHHHCPPRFDHSGSTLAISVRQLSIAGNPISMLGSEFALQFEASNLELNQKMQPDGKLLLILHRTQDGNVRFEIARAALERMITRGATKVAEKQGVTIDTVQLNLIQRGPRSLDGKLTMSAHKLIFHPVLHLTGTMAVSDDLVATLSNLHCCGDGAIAALACAAITPYFARVEQRAFPLSALPLGEVHVHDLALDLVSEKIVVSSRFGSQ